MECSVCHKEISAGVSFCPHCGAAAGVAAAGYQPVREFTPAGGAAPPPPGGTGYAAGGYPPPPSGYPPPAGFAAPGLSNTAAAAIAYITIIPAIVFLVLEPYNKVPLVRFHAFQSIGLFVAAVVLHIAVTILQVGLHFVMGTFLLFSLLHTLISLGLFIVWLVAILKASKGEWYKLPVIGDFAEKQARG